MMTLLTRNNLVKQLTKATTKKISFLTSEQKQMVSS